MADRYQAFTGTPAGKFLVKNLGLPDPTPLRRYTQGAPVVEGDVHVGGTGRLVPVAKAAATEAGATVVESVAEDARVHGLVFDASDITSSDKLVALQEYFTPLLRRLGTCARVVVLGTTPELTSDGATRIAQRALEGFTRSLAKEMRKGATVQLVYVAPDADDRLASTLQFLLSYKSAYVDGQVVRIGTDVDGDVHVADLQRPLEGQVALVTGASRGIGESIARTLHRDGAIIVGVDIPQAAGDLTTLMDELGGEAVALDITTKDAPARLSRTLRDRFGGVDVVVHNAGITRDRKLANMAADRFSSVIDVNLRAPERITAELIEEGVLRTGGRVIGIASIAGIAGNLGQTNYGASKAGVIGFVDVFSRLAAPHGITVNGVAPGFIETKMTAAIPFGIREAGRRMNAMSQGGQPVDVAETIAWFCSPASTGLTGNVVRVCGQSLLGA